MSLPRQVPRSSQLPLSPLCRLRKVERRRVLPVLQHQRWINAVHHRKNVPTVQGNHTMQTSNKTARADMLERATTRGIEPFEEGTQTPNCKTLPLQVGNQAVKRCWPYYNPIFISPFMEHECVMYYSLPWLGGTMYQAALPSQDPPTGNQCTGCQISFSPITSVHACACTHPRHSNNKDHASP